MPYVCVAIYAVVFFIPYGMGVGELKGNTALAQSLFATLSGHYQSLYGSPLGPIIAHTFGIYSQTSYILMCLGFVGLCLWALTRAVMLNARSTRHALDTLVLLSLSPIMLLLFSWVGKTDPLIIISYLGFITVRHPILRNIAVICLLLAHEQIGVLLLGVHYTLHFNEVRQFHTYVPGLLVGLGGLTLYHHYLPPFEDRLAFVAAPQRWGGWLFNIFHFPLILWTGFGWFWIVVGWAFVQRWIPRLTLLLAVTLPLMGSVFAYDSTRVFLLIGFPIVWKVLEKYKKYGEPLPYSTLVPVLALSFIQSRYQTPEFRLTWTNWHTYPWEQMKVWLGRYF